MVLTCQVIRELSAFSAFHLRERGSRVTLATELHETAPGASTLAIAGRADPFTALFERSGICMAELAPDLAILDANDDFCRQFGWDPRALDGRSFLDVMHPGSGSRLRRDLVRQLEGPGSRLVQRVLGVGPSGAMFHCQVVAVGVRDGFGRIVMIIALVKPEKATGDAGVVPAGRGTTLSKLDARILEGIAAGDSSQRIAGRLYLSRQAVEYHVCTMLRKFDVAKRAALVSKAYSLGVLEPGIWPPRVAAEAVK